MALYLAEMVNAFLTTIPTDKTTTNKERKTRLQHVIYATTDLFFKINKCAWYLGLDNIIDSLGKIVAFYKKKFTNYF